MTADDAEGFARLAQRVLTALLSESYRRDPAVWDPDEESETTSGDRLEVYFGKPEAHRPYFEVLSVTPNPPGNWEKGRQETPAAPAPGRPLYLRAGSGRAMRGTPWRRPSSDGRNLQAVTIYDGFGYRSPLDMPCSRNNWPAT